MAQAAHGIVHPDKKIRFPYTTSSSSLQEKLGVAQFFRNFLTIGRFKPSTLSADWHSIYASATSNANPTGGEKVSLVLHDRVVVQRTESRKDRRRHYHSRHRQEKPMEGKSRRWRWCRDDRAQPLDVKYSDAVLFGKCPNGSQD